MKKINDDGLPEGGFSKLPYPAAIYGKESYAQYRSRVNELVKQGFHLGDLSWEDYICYCKGSGQYDGVDSNDLV